MNTEIYKSLRHTFTAVTGVNNKSTVELCITELSAGNFPKAIDASDELIKKDIDDSVGWALKALSQAYLFDYAEKFFYLKSSLSSLNEFLTKSKLSQKDKIAVESLFYTTILERTVLLVKERIEEVIELRKKANLNIEYATASSVAAMFSAYAGARAKSDIGFMLGVGGATAGFAASSNFMNNAQLLNNASKGVFGIAVANIAYTVNYAKKLKINLTELEYEINVEATNSLQNWLTVVAFLYRQVIENLLAYTKVMMRGNEYYTAVKELSNSHEAIQFIYLSKFLGIDKSLKQFGSIERGIEKIKNTDLNEIYIGKRNKYLHYFVALFATIIPFSMFAANGLFAVGLIIFILVCGGGIYYLVTPNGSDLDLRDTMDTLISELNRFKISTDKLIIENMVAVENR